jgi:hypothetical protein
MMRLSLLVFVALGALWPGAARAEMVQFAYSWSFGDVQLAAQGPGPIHLSSIVSSDRSTLTVNYGGAMAVLTVAPPGSASAPIGAQEAGIPAASFRLISLPGGPGGDFSFTASIRMILHVKDLATGESGDLSLVRDLGGLGPLGPVTTYGDPHSPPPVLLGGHVYAAHFGIELAVMPVLDGDPVGFGVSVAVDDPAFPAGGPGTPQLPEPSALALGASALSVLGLARCRRRGARLRSA